MSDTVNDAIVDITTKISALPEVATDKVLYVYSQERLMDETEGLDYPLVGVIYAGMLKKEGRRPGSDVQGRTQTLFIDVVVTQGPVCDATTGLADEKHTTTDLLNKIRNQIIAECERAPAGHKWTFRAEVPAYLNLRLVTATDSPRDRAKILAYVQRWETTVIVGIGAVTAIT